MSYIPILHAIDGAMRLLPRQMGSGEARVMLFAIGLQESRFKHRVQIRGPARGYWQFEKAGGVRGVMGHRSTQFHVRNTCAFLNYPVDEATLYNALAYDVVLAAAMARLLLWTLPRKLPAIDDPQEAWKQYIAGWNPGKPHPGTWAQLHAQAVNVVINDIGV